MGRVSINEQVSAVVEDNFRNEILSQQKEEVRLQYRLTKKFVLRFFVDIRNHFEKYGEIVVFSDF